MPSSSHTLARTEVVFDDDRAVADGGLVLVMMLAERLGLRDLVDANVDLGDAAGRANVGLKAAALVASLLADGDSIADTDALRAGECEEVIGQWMPAPSTLGTYLRSFSWGHARQLDVVSRELMARAFDAGAGPGDAPFTVDIDSTICETYGLAKQGGSKFTYTHVRGYHPVVAVMAGTGDVVHARLRGGNANSGRGAAGFVTECISRLRDAGATGAATLRADSGFYAHAVVEACRKTGVRYSITVRMNKALHNQIGALAEDAWTPIPYFLDGADVAETTYRPFGTKGQPCRLIVRRVRPTPGSQLALFVTFTYHAFISDRDGDTLFLEADHRRHAEIENTIRDLKYGVGLNHMPSGRFGANAAWLALNVIAHNLLRWTTRIGLHEPLLRTDTIRRRYIRIPGHITHRGRGVQLHLARRWPWRHQFLAAAGRIRQLEVCRT